jgi:hypothetical protein
MLFVWEAIFSPDKRRLSQCSELKNRQLFVMQVQATGVLSEHPLPQRLFIRDYKMPHAARAAFAQHI